jgi:hypothetical protein
MFKKIEEFFFKYVASVALSVLQVILIKEGEKK